MCGTNFISIRALKGKTGYVAPVSGLHVEDLPGISLNRLASIEFGKNESAVELFNNKLAFAVESVFEDVKAQYIEAFLVNEAIDAGSMGNFDDELFTTGLTGDCGQEVKKHYSHTSKLHILQARVKVNQTLPGQKLKLVDGTETKEYDFDAVAGEEVVVPIGHMSTTGKVRLSIPATLEPYRGDITRMKGLRGCNTCDGPYTYQHLTAIAFDANGDQTDLRGISVDAAAECNLESALCLLLHKLRMPVLYKLGILLLQEWLASDRLNFMTIHGKKWAAEQLHDWEKIDYPQHLKTQCLGLGNYLSKLDPKCISRNATRYEEAVP